ncbi:MAG: hypothetical protein ACUVRH_06880 [Candidatus Bipolaricaulia bacterium]
MISESLQPFCPICDKFLYDPETEYPHICDKHLIDADLKRFFEKLVAAINTIIAEIEALEGGEEVGFDEER